jgi:hypothetical protein
MKRIWYKKKRYWILIICSLFVFSYFYIKEFETPEGLINVGYNTNLNLENCTLISDSSKWDWDDYSEEVLIYVPKDESLNIVTQLKNTTGFNTPTSLFHKYENSPMMGLWQKTDSVTYVFYDKDNHFPNALTEKEGFEKQMDWPGYYIKASYNSRSRILRYKYVKY